MEQEHGSRASADRPDATDELRRLERLARLLDSSIQLPGGMRIGLDGIIGLIPGIGDAVGATLSTYLIARAARLGASVPVLLRMMANVLIETVVGAVPVLGDLFDFAWKANDRNIRLLLRQFERQPAQGTARSRLTRAGMVILVAFGVVLLAVIVFAVSLAIALVGLLLA